jgi:signal transduction histidine kinase
MNIFDNPSQPAHDLLVQARNILDNNHEESLRLAYLVLALPNISPETIANANVIVISVLQRKGDYSNALQIALDSLQIACEYHNDYLVGRLHNNIGNIYFKMNEDAKAFEQYTKAEQFADYFTDTEKCLIKGNIGMIYFHNQNYEAASEQYSKALAIARSINNKSLIARMLNNIGILHGTIEEFDKAIAVFIEAKAIAEEIGNIHVLINCNGNLAGVYSYIKQFDTAIEMAVKNISIAEKYNEKDLLRQAWLSLSGIYELANKFPEALDAHKKYMEIYQEILSEHTIATLSELRAKYDAEKIEEEKEIFRIRNIELTQLNEKLDRINREKDDILGIAVHDLKNPLFIIRWCAEMIKQSLDEDKKEEIREAIQDIDRSSATMLDIVTSLLDLNRIESGNLPVLLQPYNVDDIIQYSYATYRSIAANKKIDIIHLRSDEVLIVNVDLLLCKQILDNLLSNAVKYSFSGSTISIETKKTSHQTVIISIADQGQGFSPDDLTKIFKKFQRLSSLPTGGEHSTGLGLSIVKQLVEVMNAKIWVESKGKTKGATFFLEVELLEG